ncbi:MAG TPA: glycosyltransferase family 4 protein [Armatimonadota bacterium]|nr:glycosyltransferase family 4 protein [Armatimonadota bacterium]HOM83925.1 glycosyltransferase family 4 protein [Armatimonadota bacterium]HPO74933.1 glycosyltransferase family 4 protein [Armatimonadota bacterium]
MQLPPAQRSRPLTILMAADVDPIAVIGGAERVLNEHSKRLAARGHRVIVLTRREDPARPTHEIFSGVEVYRHPVCQGNPVTFMRSTIREGARAVSQILARESIDLINVHQPLAASAVLHAPGATRYPFVYTFLSPWADEFRVRAKARSTRDGRRLSNTLRWAIIKAGACARRRIENHALAACRRILVLSDFSADQLWSIHGIGGERITRIPGGVDADRFRPVSDRHALRRALGRPTDGLLLFTVRNLVPRMGLENLLEAMVPVVQARPDVHLVIGGTGPLRDALHAQTDRLGLSEHVTFAGFIAEDLLPKYYAAADLFVLPTALLEGFGLVTIEALACGTPAVGTPIGGTQEILRDLDPRFLFRSPSADDIAAGLLERIPEVAGNQALRARCRQFVEERYSWEAVIPRLEALFYATAGLPGPDPREVGAPAWASAEDGSGGGHSADGVQRHS